MKKLTFRTVLRMISSFMIFFLTIGFAVSCCMMLFLNVIAETMGLEFTAENIAAAAKITLVNVLIITAIFTWIDYIRRRMTVDRPVRIITEAAEKITKGDLSVRIKPMQGAATEGFNRIITAVNSMTEELSDEKRFEYAKGVTDASRRLADMMTNILKLNRRENQTIFPQKAVFDLGEQLCESLLQYESIWEKSDIEIETDIEDEVKVEADSELLSLVWNNLFSNAFKFTGEGGKVRVSLTTDGHYAVVSVSDTGCGMTTEVGAHIFEKFYQGDTSRATQGNGLGLALVKRVVDIMQGEIGVESAVGKGTTFTVKIEKV